MNRILLALVLVTAGVFSVQAQVPKEKTLLWQVSGNGVAAPSYLYGTFHLMCPDDLKMPEVVKQKFNTAKQLYLEVDMDDPAMMVEMMKGMQMKDSSTLPLLLKNDYDSVGNIFQSTTGISLKMFNKTKPLLLMSMIYPSLIGCQPVSWDGEFMNMAKEKNLEVKGLENVADQVKVFDSISYQLQAEMLMKTMYNLDSAKNSFRDLEAIYQQKDINKMQELTTSDKDFSNYESVLLLDRNRNWIPVIGQQAKKMPTFFAFGAGHLGGKNGVINLLRKSGFKVTPVFY